MIKFIQTFTYPQIIWILAFLAFILFLIIRGGFFIVLKRIIYDCLIDHATGKVTINNLGRLSLLFTLLFLLVSTHFNIQVNPLHISPIPLSELELASILAFIATATYINKDKVPSITQKFNVESENTNINTPQTPAESQPS